MVTRIIDGTDHFVECDTLLTAISEKPDFKLFGDAPVVLNEWGWPVLTEGQKVEGLRNVWVAGDFCLGPKTVVEAVGSARNAVDDIMKSL